MFFGRRRLVKEMLTRLAEPGVRGRLVAVIGASGSGKSSIVQAGLVPALREGGVDDSVEWFVARMTPGDDPFTSCRSALEAVAVRSLERLDEPVGGDLLARCVAASLPATTLMLVIDQFEELFAATASLEARDEFVDMITEAVTDTTGKVRVVLTLRADFYDRPLQYPRFGRLLHECQVVVTAPTDDDLLAAIEGPAELVGMEFDAGLVRILARDFERNASLPLLQHTLVELSDRRDGRPAHRRCLRGDGRDRRRARTEGGVAVQRVRRGRNDPLVRRLFTRLVAIGDGSGDTRRRVQRRELDGLADSTATVDDILERFGAARLLSFDPRPRRRVSRPSRSRTKR